MVTCEACRERAGTDRHHIVSRGSGGPDEGWNVVQLCRFCHTHFHQIGWRKFNLRFPHLEPTVLNARRMMGRKE